MSTRIPGLIRSLRLTMAATLLLASTHTAAAPSICATHYHNGLAPDFLDARYPTPRTEVCTADAALMLAGGKTSILWIGEHLIPSIPPASRIPGTQHARERRTQELMSYGLSEQQASYWMAVESAVMNLSSNLNRDFYVISGFIWPRSTDGVNKAPAPSHLYKVVLDPIDSAATAYLISTSDGTGPSGITAAELSRIAGIRFFPRQDSMPMLLLR